jgi:hypothetical protein
LSVRPLPRRPPFVSDAVEVAETGKKMTPGAGAALPCSFSPSHGQEYRAGQEDLGLVVGG